jgi:hypothetical protein
MKRISMTKGKMWFPLDVDPTACDWEPLPSGRATPAPRSPEANRKVERPQHTTNSPISREQQEQGRSILTRSKSWEKE